jgi:NAD(P)-dependent dehydrogenase (short-subunit alcohol dehydrogenase family)
MDIVITGAASGIGEALVGLLDAEPDPHRLVLVDRDQRRLAIVAEDTRSPVSLVAADLGDPHGAEAVADVVQSDLGRLDAIVSNAGIIGRGPLLDQGVDDFDVAFAVNVRATFLLATALHGLLAASRGCLVATASMSARHPTPGVGLYSASKAALVMLVRQLAVEWRGDGIRCNTVSPGPTMTPMTAGGYDDPDRRAQREAMIPTGRLGEPMDVAHAIRFLLGPGAAQVDGVDLLVDGGMSSMLMPATGGGTGQAASRPPAPGPGAPATAD